MSHFAVFEHHFEKYLLEIISVLSWMMFNQDVHQPLLNPIKSRCFSHLSHEYTVIIVNLWQSTFVFCWVLLFSIYSKNPEELNYLSKVGDVLQQHQNPIEP